MTKEKGPSFRIGGVESFLCRMNYYVRRNFIFCLYFTHYQICCQISVRNGHFKFGVVLGLIFLLLQKESGEGNASQNRLIQEDE
ncbi:hypothetical protein [Dysosmobacter sp. Sow4_B12]|uniref:hypothetical protein n=1 Tax=Dysosmobacter sp. Sow4_B12 TaxID=3438777 RepID=UPI003F9205DB